MGELAEFVGSGDIEEMFGVSRQRVYQLTTRRDFPEPAIVSKGNRRLWRSADVVRWAEEKGREVHE